ncbi:Low-density lipoprotein receptor-related protein 11 [Frankliniella fusca]|uniref:Low-density lipoprotein receptor-related protein 11 n=1 Tax=Frankliniella fusca TaxID=407009 RepID=A0AAE1H4V6_9NEOP|nr:Low-density lipoprotein receptor-related protein 11 [Frankliniella fusca]
MDAHGVVVLLVGVLGVAATAASSAGASSPGELSPAGAGMGAALGMLPLRVAKRYDLDLQTCVDSFDVQRDQIIRTQDSKRMGAVNLAVKDVLTRDECLRLCCETDKCDVFVFEEKQSPGTCYMFHCGPPEDSRCKFTRHESYSTGILDTRRRILDQHEQDLSSLR